jgi:hypothetical protein
MSPPGPDIISSIRFKIIRSTTSPCAASLTSNWQCVTAAERDCIAKANLGDSGLIKPYARNFRRAPKARIVIGAAVPLVCIMWRNGVRSERASKE